MPKNDPRILGKVPPGMILTPRSAFQAKPWIDLPWFGGKRLRFPTTSSLPKGFKDDPSISGILTWREGVSSPGTVPRRPLPASLAGLTAFLFNKGTWTDEEGRKTELPAKQDSSGVLFSTGEEYAILPFVYGDRPRQFNVSWADPTGLFGPPGTKVSIVTAQIELPPNHRPAPKTNVIEAPLKKGKLVLSPQPETSPGFARRFSVQIEGVSEVETFLIEFRSVTDESIGSADLIVEPGRPATYTHQTKASEISAVVRFVKPEKIELRAVQRRKVPGGPAIPQVFDLKDAKGNALALAYDVGASAATVLPTLSDRKLLNLTVDGSAPHSGGYTRGEPNLDWILATRTDWSNAHLKLKDGQIVGATIYREHYHEVVRIQLR